MRPAKGAQSGGTKVTITGTGFAAGRDRHVRRERGAARSTSSAARGSPPSRRRGRSARSRSASRNPGLPAALLENAFEYVAAPTITSVKPAKGPVAGGTKVTITGTGFAPRSRRGGGQRGAREGHRRRRHDHPDHDAAGQQAPHRRHQRDEPRRAAGRSPRRRSPTPRAVRSRRPSPRRPARRRPRFRAAAASTAGSVVAEAGNDLVLDAAALFPASTGVRGATLREADFRPKLRARGRIDPVEGIAARHLLADARRGRARRHHRLLLPGHELHRAGAGHDHRDVPLTAGPERPLGRVVRLATTLGERS